MTVRPLPRSLDPLPDESLPGYVLRLAHRLDLAPGRIGQLTGLSRPLLPRRDTPRIPAVRMLHLDAATAATFANTTRLSAPEVAGLCLDRLRGRYPPLDLDYQVIAVRHRQASGIPGLASWVLTRSTRYCPQCLAGDGSSIQRAHGGAWQQLWRLPPVFVCITHQRLLAHECPACHRPIHSHRGNTALLPRLQDASLHPSQCRTTIGAGHWRQLSACGARLDIPAPGTASRAGKVWLLGRKDLPSDWNPTADRRTPVWEVAQHLVKRLEESGEQSAAELLQGVGGLGDVARDLAYRLFAVCERKKWTQEGLAFNSLVISWPEIARRAGVAPMPGAPVQQTLA